MEKRNTPDQILFFETLARGDHERLRTIVAGNPTILNCHDYRNFGATPLTMACFSNQAGLVATLLELGADPNKKSDWSMGPWSPLHCAIFRRDKSLAEFLLHHGATMDAHTAAGLGQYDTLLRLLDADPSRANERGGDGCQPLHFADTTQVAQLLMERGADKDGRCIDHYSTPVQYLCTTRPEVARYLLAAGASADIFSSILCGDVPSVETLLNAKPDLIHARINQSFFPPSSDHNVHNILSFSVGVDSTPMHAAAKGNRMEAISMLAGRGLSINVRGGYDHATSLHTAAWSNCAVSAKALIDNGADIEARSGKLHNNTPAGWAIVAGADEVFELLLDNGAQRHPWFMDDARDACEGRFDQVANASSQQRNRILSKLLQQNQQ
jgi:ankyrin repeat protein